MSLLKSLQKNLTCVNIPWVPVGKPESRYLINEIALGEESDVDKDGKRISHFELYLKAMEQAGCDMDPIKIFIKSISKMIPVAESSVIAGIPMESAQFMENTFAVIKC